MISKSGIGNTPMIKIFYEYEGIEDYIFAKLEYYNRTGSIKDRIAYRILNKAIEKGELKDGMPIVEATSGNTGISLAALGSYYKHPVVIFMPDWASKERVDLMKGFGANVILISKEDGGFIRCVNEAKKYAEENNGFLVNQFANRENLMAHYEETASEILEQMPIKPLGFVSGVGTGGTLMGIGKRLKDEYEDSKIIAIEPDKMPIISTGKIISSHKIEGIGDDFVPDLVDKSVIDDIILVNDDDAINMARKLAKELGLGVGISSGANLIGAVLSSRKLKNTSSNINERAIVTVFADDNKKYLSTDLSKSLDDLNIDTTDFISTKVKLLRHENV